MSRYAIIKAGIVNNVIIADQPIPKIQGLWVCIDSLDRKPGPGWTYDGESFSPPVEPPDPPISIIDKIEFRFRLTDAEYVGILSAAKTDVEVQAWVETFNMTSSIDLESSHTISGMEMMVTKGLLTEERKAEILTAPVEETERP